MKQALIFDIETTGLFRYDIRAHEEGQPRLCAFAAAILDIKTRETVKAAHRLCDGATFSEDDWKRAEAPDGAFKQNGLSRGLMTDVGYPIDVILRDFAQLEDECLGQGGYVAFNGFYDLKLMRGERRRLSLDDRYNYMPLFDPMREMRHLVSKQRGLSQTRLYEELIGEEPASRTINKALADIFNLCRIFVVALDHCQPLNWEYHKTKNPAEEDVP